MDRFVFRVRCKEGAYTPPWLPEIMAYLLVGFTRGPVFGEGEWEGYVRLHKRARLGKMREILGNPDAFVESAIGSEEHNRAYFRKFDAVSEQGSYHPRAGLLQRAVHGDAALDRSVGVASVTARLYPDDTATRCAQFIELLRQEFRARPDTGGKPLSELLRQRIATRRAAFEIAAEEARKEAALVRDSWLGVWMPDES